MFSDPHGTLEETLERIHSVLVSAITRLGGMDLDAEDLAELINVNANDGSNEPAEYAAVQAVDDARIDLWSEIQELCGNHYDHTCGMRAIDRQEKRVSAAMDAFAIAITYRCGHA